MVYNESSKRATMKYQKKLYTFTFRIRPEEADSLRAVSESAGYDSVRSYVIDAINEKAGKTVIDPPRK